MVKGCIQLGGAREWKLRAEEEKQCQGGKKSERSHAKCLSPEQPAYQESGKSLGRA